MAATKNNVGVPLNTWVDLYALSGITVGTAVDIFNRGNNDVLICASTAAPTSTSIGVPCFAGKVGNYLHVTTGEAGLWAYCSSGTGILLVQN